MTLLVSVWGQRDELSPGQETKKPLGSDFLEFFKRKKKSPWKKQSSPKLCFKCIFLNILMTNWLIFHDFFCSSVLIGHTKAYWPIRSLPPVCPVCSDVFSSDKQYLLACSDLYERVVANKVIISESLIFIILHQSRRFSNLSLTSSSSDLCQLY